MRKILIDTNAYSRFMAGEQSVLNELSRADQIYLSVFVLGELFTGFQGGSKQQQNRLWLEQFTLRPTVHVLNATQETAEVFAKIKTALKKSGRPIPINDVWIAAHSIETGSVLVTFDTHFDNVPGLRLWDHVEHQQV